MFGSKKEQNGTAPVESPDAEAREEGAASDRGKPGESICIVPATAYIGRRRHIDTKAANNEEQLRAFWDTCREDGTLDALRALAAPGVDCLSGACTNFGSHGYDYWIAVEAADGAEVPEGYERLEVPERKCAVFACEGPAREAVAQKWHYIYNKWFPRARFNYDSNPEIENYPFGDMLSADYRCEILVPVRPVEALDQPAKRRDGTMAILFVAVGSLLGMFAAGQSDKPFIYVLVGGAAGYFVFSYITKRRDEIRAKKRGQGGEDEREK